MADTLRRLADRVEIVEVLNRYCRGVDRCDEATLASVYHPDGTDDHGTFVGNGREFAAWAAKGAAGYWAASHHTVHNVIVDWVDDDTAEVECYVLALNHRRDGGDGGPGRVEVFGGRYLDRFERRDGVWRIAHRVALRDVDTLVDRERWAARINPGGRFPDDALYRAPHRHPGGADSE
jgi:hypothetical protein